MPETSENFVSLFKGFKNKDNQKIELRGKKFSNGIDGILLETEEIPDTIYGKGMPNESYSTSFHKEGVVAMSKTALAEEEKSSSGFFITFRPIDFLEKYVVVGEVVEGLSDLKRMASNKETIKIGETGHLGTTGV